MTITGNNDWINQIILQLSFGSLLCEWNHNPSPYVQIKRNDIGRVDIDCFFLIFFFYLELRERY